jgi:hypothetical protein
MREVGHYGLRMPTKRAANSRPTRLDKHFVDLKKILPKMGGRIKQESRKNLQRIY